MTGHEPHDTIPTILDTCQQLADETDQDSSPRHYKTRYEAVRDQLKDTQREYVALDARYTDEQRHAQVIERLCQAQAQLIAHLEQSLQEARAQLVRLKGDA